MKLRPFTVALTAFLVIVAYASVAQFLGLSYWRPNITTDVGIVEYLLLALLGVGLGSLAKRESRRVSHAWRERIGGHIIAFACFTLYMAFARLVSLVGLRLPLCSV